MSARRVIELLCVALLSGCSSDSALWVELVNVSDANAPTIVFDDVSVRLQPVGAPRSVDWRSNPASDQWWTPPPVDEQVRLSSGQRLRWRQIKPPDGRWQRVWLDVSAAATAHADGLSFAEDHCEPTAVELRWPEDVGATLQIDVIALPSPTTSTQWATFVSRARVAH